MEVNSLLDGISGLIVAGYVGAVIINGQLLPLFNEVKTELGYLEFLVAIYLIKMVMEFPPTSTIGHAFFVLGILAAAIKFSSAVDLDLFRKFLAGEITLFQVIGGLASGIGGAINPLPDVAKVGE